MEGQNNNNNNNNNNNSGSGSGPVAAVEEAREIVVSSSSSLTAIRTTSSLSSYGSLPWVTSSAAVLSESIVCADELVGEYLLFRGFSQTLRLFYQERKADKSKGFQASFFFFFFVVVVFYLSHVHSLSLFYRL